MADRILWEAGREVIDEIVLNGVDIHIERMSHGSYWIGIRRGTEDIFSGDIGTRGRGVVRFTVSEDDVKWTRDDEHEGV